MGIAPIRSGRRLMDNPFLLEDASRIRRQYQMFVRIGGRQMYLWRAVDADGEVLEILVQAQRDKRAALRLIRKLLKKQGAAAAESFADKCPSYGAAFRELTPKRALHTQAKRANNRAESSRVPVRRRERKLQGFKSPGSA
jgi:putative transposase